MLLKTFDDDGPVLLAVLGRGSQQDSQGQWVLTELFEICDEKGAHLATQLPENDDHPNSCIGGSALNVRAGIALYEYFRPAMTVFAYGSRSKYLYDINAPSESMVMTDEFLKLMEAEANPPQVDIFDETAWDKTNAGTNQELRNIFALALQFGIKNVAIVTVAVHAARTALMIEGHLQDPAFVGQIFPQLYVTEEILEQADPMHYAGLFEKSVTSKSFVRTFRREIGFGGIYPRGGLNAYFAGVMQTASSTIVSR